MSGIAVAGAGAFGTALAIALSAPARDVTLWARDGGAARTMQAARENARYLAGARFPDHLTATGDRAALNKATTVLLAIPSQHLRGFIEINGAELADKTCVICCKGIEKETGLLPADIVQGMLSNAKVAVLTGPGFAAELAAGLPTALTLAATGQGASRLQALLSTGPLRLYLSDDLTGAALGGALKNVVAIGCGITIGAGLGESARAALMTRGYAEIRRLAIDMGAKPATLSGLSGLGDLALTCGSEKSRNFSLGLRLGRGQTPPGSTTVEGVATAHACLTLAASRGIEMPLTSIVAKVLKGRIDIPEAVDALLSRPLKPEN